MGNCTRGCAKTPWSSRKRAQNGKTKGTEDMEITLTDRFKLKTSGALNMQLYERREVKDTHTTERAGEVDWMPCGDGCYRELCEAFGVEPKRTVEDVLEEFIAAYDEWDDNCHDDREGQRQAVFEHYADELRGMGVCDAEHRNRFAVRRMAASSW